MFRKVLAATIVVGAVLIASTQLISAQTAGLNGRVVAKDANGKQTPIAGAIVDVYRTDIKANQGSTKTDKGGYFTFVAVPLGGVFIIAVSAPGYQAQVFPNVHAGQGEIVIWIDAGDGAHLTEDQARHLAADPTIGQNGAASAEARKQAAEAAAKKKEIEEKNAKVLKTNEVVAAAIKAGNEAVQAKNYDLAIAKYTEGLNADPDFVSTATVFLRNRGIALKKRAIDEYNASIKETDASAKVADRNKVKDDLAQAASGYLKAFQMLKTASPADAADKTQFDQTRVLVLEASIEAFDAAAKTEQVDPAVMDAAKVLIPEYIAAQNDANKKTDANLIMAELLRASGDYQAAIDGYKKVLDSSPENPDALAMIGVCYYALGAANGDKTMYQQGANYLQKYVSVAPEGHRYKKDVTEILDALKKENVTPQKPANNGGKKRGS